MEGGCRGFSIFAHLSHHRRSVGTMVIPVRCSETGSESDLVLICREGRGRHDFRKALPKRSRDSRSLPPRERISEGHCARSFSSWSPSPRPALAKATAPKNLKFDLPPNADYTRPLLTYYPRNVPRIVSYYELGKGPRDKLSVWTVEILRR